MRPWHRAVDSREVTLQSRPLPRAGERSRFSLRGGESQPRQESSFSNRGIEARRSSTGRYREPAGRGDATVSDRKRLLSDLYEARMRCAAFESSRRKTPILVTRSGDLNKTSINARYGSTKSPACTRIVSDINQIFIGDASVIRR